MRLADQAFQKIKSGSKTLELRIGDDKRRAVAVGDLIRFHRMDRSQSVLVEVLDLPDPRHMYTIYPPALLKEKGALAFRIQLLDPDPEGG